MGGRAVGPMANVGLHRSRPDAPPRGIPTEASLIGPPVCRRLMTCASGGNFHRTVYIIERMMQVEITPARMTWSRFFLYAILVIRFFICGNFSVSTLIRDCTSPKIPRCFTSASFAAIAIEIASCFDGEHARKKNPPI